MIDSAECVADEESRLREQKLATPSGSYIPKDTWFVPTLVTNAELRVCLFDPKDVNLDRGELATSDAEFESVPFIRFRKSIGSRYDTSEPAGVDLQKSNLRRERSLFVVQALHLAQFLRLCPGD